MKIFVFLFSIALLTACAAGETETLKKARAAQEDLMTDVHDLDSAVSTYANKLNGDISAAGMDSTLQTDTSKMKSYTELKDRFNEVTLAQSEIMDWKSNLKTLPTIKEIEEGAENPFGKDAKDSDILASIEKSKVEFEVLKKRVMEMMQ